MNKRLIKIISIGILLCFILGILSIQISNYIVAAKEIDLLNNKDFIPTELDGKL